MFEENPNEESKLEVPPDLLLDDEEIEESKKRRLSLEFRKEQEELRRLLLEEEFVIKENSGNEPTVNVSMTNINTWIYPVDKTFRTYQFKIVRTALFENTLVTLPTGLGKTLIASTVMFNYYRWFTNGLIFFVAPTRPLVDQQVDAFQAMITEVPLSDIEQLTGKQN